MIIQQACNSVFWESLENSVFQFYIALLPLFTMATDTNISTDSLRRGLRSLSLHSRPLCSKPREQENTAESDKARLSLKCKICQCLTFNCFKVFFLFYLQANFPFFHMHAAVPEYSKSLCFLDI